ncbi:S1C family serine protease [Caloramator proteoclasticus]|uniref:Serine protease Do n=1 Tax=Caloramator proteoclasticus DSM 10124 TaxID=1121262 RepID=A0A1M4YLJ1_9CLOT|nr:trypsin-like peptidase domain-containing protein [Caloramator proteoclasticus]SHF06523.1 serine protease Do [Caloramator proteoclasticus DSM 10124]
MDYNNGSWQSGVKFVEEKRSKKILRFLALIFIVFFSAGIGGIIGGYYVKKNYTEAPLLNNQLNTKQEIVTNIPKNSITKVAEVVGPAVVGITNNVTTFTGRTVKQGTGSGIIFDKSGYIVTNQHVIDGASEVYVTLAGGKKLPARVIGADYRTDLAVLKIEAQNLPVAKFGDSSNVRVGDIAVAIGNPLGEEFSGSVTAGVISAVNRKMTVDGRTYKVIQTDASINPGNSGGALCNEAGEVIGINSLKISSAEGMGFAISINEAKPIIESLMKNGYVSRPFIGIYYEFIDEEIADEYNVPVGVNIRGVERGSGAEEAGIRPGDIIVNFDGVDIKRMEDLSDVLEKHKVGDIVSARIWRDGKYIDVKIKLGEKTK